MHKSVINKIQANNNKSKSLISDHQWNIFYCSTVASDHGPNDISNEMSYNVLHFIHMKPGK